MVDNPEDGPGGQKPPPPPPPPPPESGRVAPSTDKAKDKKAK